MKKNIATDFLLCGASGWCMECNPIPVHMHSIHQPEAPHSKKSVAIFFLSAGYSWRTPKPPLNTHKPPFNETKQLPSAAWCRNEGAALFHAFNFISLKGGLCVFNGGFGVLQEYPADNIV